MESDTQNILSFCSNIISLCDLRENLAEDFLIFLNVTHLIKATL